MKHLTRIFNSLKPFDWCDAFYKFGFDDGDGHVHTFDVAAHLTKQGYDVKIGMTGIHNSVINSITQNGKEVLPLNNPFIRYGYEHPRNYLPNKIIAELDKAFPFENALSGNEFYFKQLDCD
ncbi:hypothetical protein NBRC116494_07050 [Aurantivibrio plasticivorans]